MIETPCQKSAKTLHLFDSHWTAKNGDHVYRTYCGVIAKHKSYADKNTTIYLCDATCEKCRKHYWKIRNNLGWQGCRHIDDSDVKVDWTESEGFVEHVDQDRSASGENRSSRKEDRGTRKSRKKRKLEVRSERSGDDSASH